MHFYLQAHYYTADANCADSITWRSICLRADGSVFSALLCLRCDWNFAITQPVIATSERHSCFLCFDTIHAILLAINLMFLFAKKGEHNITYRRALQYYYQSHTLRHLHILTTKLIIQINIEISEL
jgi:hypothetical protein